MAWVEWVRSVGVVAPRVHRLRFFDSALSSHVSVRGEARAACAVATVVAGASVWIRTEEGEAFAFAIGRSG